jgi:hypothetical protein
MNFLKCICFPFLLQVAITWAIVSFSSGGGSFVGLGALLFAVIGIPATAIVNFSLIKAKPAVGSGGLFLRSLLVSLLLPLAQIGLLIAVSAFRL